MKKPFLLSLVFFGTLAILTVGYAAWNSPLTMITAESWSGLTANGWNALVNNINDLNTRLSNAEATIASQTATISTLAPAGAVIAFNLANCPTGWSEYMPARWRFIRGIDSTGLNDSVRPLESLQDDALQNIIGTATPAYWNAHWWSFSGAFYWVSQTVNTMWNGPISGYAGSGIGFDASRSARTSTETRPKNVALLYCKKM